MLQDRLDKTVGDARNKYVGLAAAAVQDGETVFAARGVADESGSLVDEHTDFEVGSVSKVFTALLLATLVSSGEVRLDEPLADFYPELRIPVRGRPVTLRDLATHTSGFPRLPRGVLRQGVRNTADPYARFTDADVAAALEGVRLRAEPGRRIRYSNFGAGVLGQALARRVGTPYGALLGERVLRPLGLADTYVGPAPAGRPHRATGHNRRHKPVPDWNMPSLPGMGAVRSTAADLARFAAAQLHPESTALAEAVELIQVTQVGAGRPLGVGLGWMVSPLGRTGETMHWHNGGTGGAASYLGLVRTRDAAVVLLTNTARSVDGRAVGLLRELVS